MKRKKLLMAVGPLGIALVLVACLLMFDIHLPLSKKEIEYQATARNYSTLKGEYVRNQILSDDTYIPYYSSSEMAIFDEFHPNVLAEKYNRDYRPYIAGRDAQGALTHFLEINSASENHRGKKVVYMMSPNSFQSPKGIPDEFYDTVHSRLELSHWLLDINKPTVSDKYAAERLLSYKTVQKDHLLAPRIKKIQKGETLSNYDELRLGLKYRTLRSEDALFSQIKNNRFMAKELPESNKLKGMNNYQYAKEYKMSHLPETYDLEKLDKLAFEIGKESSANNPFGFFDVKYDQDIGKDLAKFKNSRTKTTYTKSVEFSDFQLVLNEFARLDIEPYFVFMPIEEGWANYTGQPKAERDGVVKKIKHQLNSQGFNNFLVVDGAKKYTHVDGAHAGRRAWLEVDQVLDKFLTAPKEKHLNYTMNDFFYTKEWSQKKLD